MLELLQDEQSETRGNVLGAGLAVSVQEKSNTPDKANDAGLVRYLFNPFIVADCRSLATPVGHDYLPNGQFIKITEVELRRGKNPEDIGTLSPLETAHNNSNYYIERRPPGAIADELINLYAGAGVIELKSLRGIDDDAWINRISIALLGARVPCESDIFYDDFPVPVLPEWAEGIEGRATELIDSQTNAELQILIKSLVNEVFASLRTALTYANTLTQTAIAKTLDPAEPNKKFSPLDRRAFFALGQEIPDQLPTVTASSKARESDFGGAITELTDFMKQQTFAREEKPVVAEPIMTRQEWGEIMERMEKAEQRNSELEARLEAQAEAISTPIGLSGVISDEAKNFQGIERDDSLASGTESKKAGNKK